MRFAVISDIHNNYEAFRETLDDIERQNVEKIYCLGDLLGYGPNPVSCVDLMMDLCKKKKVEVCLRGNHDQAALFDPDGFNPIAESAIFWTRNQLESQRGARANERWDFIGNLPSKRLVDKFLFVHGSPKNPLNEYIFPDDTDDSGKMAIHFAGIPQYCFVGHTHVPGIFVDRSETEDYDYYSYDDVMNGFDGKFGLGERKLIVNVGSVGQPRDEKPESCYVVVQYNEGAAGNYVEYHRVRYDVEKTVSDFMKIDELRSFPFLWERIRSGR